MDEEDRHDQVQREASWAGLLAGLILLFLTFMFVFLSLTLAPSIQSVSAPQTESRTSEE